ncbi:MAG TPA: ATP-binding cassette domain-containing protein [Nocardioidaceae bacterium]|nr:ATP-binding cassette domain-containing protein [Nocardioidaceae bacterium]
MVAISYDATLVLDLAAAGARFGSRTVLHPVSLRVQRATTCLVHGANGSGKTTLLRLCAGLLSPTGGERWASGPSLYLRPGSGARRRQTVEEALETARTLSGHGRARLGPALEAAMLSPLRKRRVETLSSGQRSRLVIGIALVAAPALVCLDEPSAHLDDEGLSIVRAGVRQLAAVGTAVLIATHDRDLLADRPDARLLVSDGAVTDIGCSGVR